MTFARSARARSVYLLDQKATYFTSIPTSSGLPETVSPALRCTVFVPCQDFTLKVPSAFPR